MVVYITSVIGQSVNLPEFNVDHSPPSCALVCGVFLHFPFVLYASTSIYIIRKYTSHDGFFVQLWRRNSNYNIKAVVGAVEPLFNVPQF
jgi:hypothetical protein